MVERSLFSRISRDKGVKAALHSPNCMVRTRDAMVIKPMMARTRITAMSARSVINVIHTSDTFRFSMEMKARSGSSGDSRKQCGCARSERGSLAHKNPNTSESYDPDHKEVDSYRYQK